MHTIWPLSKKDFHNFMHILFPENSSLIIDCLLKTDVVCYGITRVIKTTPFGKRDHAMIPFVSVAGKSYSVKTPLLEKHTRHY